MNQFELHVPAQDLLAEVEKYFGWQPSDYSLDVSSRGWYHSAEGRKQATTARLSRKIIKALERLIELEREEALR